MICPRECIERTQTLINFRFINRAIQMGTSQAYQKERSVSASVLLLTPGSLLCRSVNKLALHILKTRCTAIFQLIDEVTFGGSEIGDQQQCPLGTALSPLDARH